MQGRWRGPRSRILLSDTTRRSLLDTTGVGGTQTTLLTYAVPAGLLRIGDLLTIQSFWSTNVGSATAKTCRVKVGGTTLHQNSMASQRQWLQRVHLHVRALSGAGSAVGGFGASNVSGSITQFNNAILETTIDWTAEVDIEFTAQWGAEDNAGNNIALESAMIELIRG